ncbi:hypothetical protein GGI12_002598 [Dipsacomyces acuminosporus]|nr:hypothetical protein GGI12_002598 [Dipsacomyces acuminosporus]
MNVVLFRLKQWVRALPGRPGHRGLGLPHSLGDYLHRMLGAQRYKGEAKPMPPPLTWSVFSGVTSFLGMATIGLIQKYGAAIADNHLPFAIAPFAATAVLIFAVPAAPLAQPRNVILGHLIAALTGIFIFEIFKHVHPSLQWLPGALAVGIAIALMGLANCYHPPAGATAFLAGFFSPDVERVKWWYPLYPVLTVSLIMVAVAMVVNNISRVYPTYWFTTAKLPPIQEYPASAQPPKTADKEEANASSSASPSTSAGSATPAEVPHSTHTVSGDARIVTESQATEYADNNYGGEDAWIAARISALEQELDSLRKTQAKLAHNTDMLA